MIEHDVIVVGSGATGAMAAQTLVESGRRVTLLDVGHRDAHYSGLIPDASFAEIRKTDVEQHRYLLGDRFESLSALDVKSGAQLTPPRRFVIEDVERFLPILTQNFAPVESLARGGLTSAWGLGCAVYSQNELQRASLDPQAMRAAYDVVAERIGISGADDAARPYTSAGIANVQPALEIDPTAGRLLQRFERNRAAFAQSGFYLGRPAMALLSQAMDGRRASTLDDMEFYSDRGGAAWRAWIAIERLETQPNFTYVPERLVLRFAESATGITVYAIDTKTGSLETIHTRTLVLAAGALGSARIALRSQPESGARLPLLCNPYSYVPCIVPERLGRAIPERRSALAQLALFHDPDGEQRDVAMGSIYSYRSLQQFRLLRKIPLPLAQTRKFLQFLLSGFLIVGVHHPHANEGGSSIALDPAPKSPTGDRLSVDFRLSVAESAAVRARERKFNACLRALGAIPVKRVDPGYGSSIHYAGTLPIAANERIGSSDADGRLHGTRRVYVADGSAFTYLPAKGLTLSIMARAHVVAANVARIS